MKEKALYTIVGTYGLSCFSTNTHVRSSFVFELLELRMFSSFIEKLKHITLQPGCVVLVVDIVENKKYKNNDCICISGISPSEGFFISIGSRQHFAKQLQLVHQ